MTKFEYGGVTRIDDNVTEPIIANGPILTTKQSLVAAAIFVVGIGATIFVGSRYIGSQAFKNGAMAFSDGEMQALDKLGLLDNK